MTELTANRPLVTFALFAYNQEAYIREAVEAAFAQTYQPLEIILSDDLSADGTFQIIKKMAEAYDGPHTVRLNKSEENKGLSAHINQVSELCSGDIIVVAAGDDISEPERVEKLVDVFLKGSDVYAALSDFYVLGTTPAKPKQPSKTQEICNAEIFYGGGGIGAGATYAYRSEVLRWPSKIPLNCISEDRLLPARAAILGSVRKLCEPLVGYRVHEQSLHAKIKREKKLAREDRDHRQNILSLIEEATVSGKLTKSNNRLFRFWFLLGTRLQSFKRNRGKIHGVLFRVLGRAMDRTALKKLEKSRKNIQ